MTNNKDKLNHIAEQLPGNGYLYRIYGSYPIAIFRLSHKSSFLRQLGWFRSSRERSSVDSLGMPLPWITYSAIYFLEKRLSPKLIIYEYGCGNSSIWWSKKVKAIFSVEHNINWYEKMIKKLPKNTKIQHIPLDIGGAYAHSIENIKNNFDIVIIDGRDRVNCAEIAINKLTNQGVIVWDNTDRLRYKVGYEMLLKKGFKALDFRGLSPIGHELSMTTIFYRKNNCLLI